MPSAFRTLAGFRDAGHEVHVVIPASAPWPQPTYEGLWIHTYSTPRFGLTGDFGPTRSAMLVRLPQGRRLGSLRWKAYLASLTLNGIIAGCRLGRRIGPDLVYGMMPQGGLASSAVGRLLGIPNVTRLFGTFLADVPRREMPRHLWELAAMKAPADLWILADDGTSSDVVAQRFGVPPDRFRHLLNGVDERYFEPWSGRPPATVKRELGADASTPLLLCAHHLMAEHHHDVLIEAMGQLRDRGVKALAVLVGDGPERERLERLLQSRGLVHHVLMPGNVERDRVRELMAAATAVVSLDEYSNVVNSVLEALAMGVPVVASDSGTTRRVLTDERDSLILARADPVTLADTLDRLLRSPELERRLRSGARETAVQQLETWSERVGREARMLEQLAAAGRGGRLPG